MKRLDGTKSRRTTADELAYICDHWATQTATEIAKTLGMRRGTVRAAASRMGLRLPVEIRRGFPRRSPVMTPGPEENGSSAIAVVVGVPSALGSHFELLLGSRRLRLTAYSGKRRVIRIVDDERTDV